MARWRKWTDKREQEFLRWLREGHTVTYACDKLDINHSTAYKHRSEDDEFRQAWEEAREAGADKLEDVALDRAFQGSDRLLEFLLKGAKPEKYKDRVAQETTGEMVIRIVDDE